MVLNPPLSGLAPTQSNRHRQTISVSAPHEGGLVDGLSVANSSVAAALVTAVFGYLPFLKRTSAVNLMAAGEYLDAMDGEKVEVFTLSQTSSIINPAVSVPLLDLFTGKQLVYRDHPAPPLAQGLIETSPLRFTWEYDTPSYFAPGPESPREIPVVVIASRANQPLPPRIGQRIAGFRLSEEFTVSDKVFKFKTIVRVYHPP